MKYKEIRNLVEKLDNKNYEDFDYMIDELRENGEIKDVPFVEEEKNNLVNIVGMSLAK